MKTLTPLFLALTCVASIQAAEPLFETTRVFAMTPDNKPNYRIPAILQAPNGDLLIFAEKRNDGIGDIGNHDLVLKRSRDKGKLTPEQRRRLDELGFCWALRETDWEQQFSELKAFWQTHGHCDQRGRARHHGNRRLRALRFGNGFA